MIRRTISSFFLASGILVGTSQAFGQTATFALDRAWVGSGPDDGFGIFRPPSPRTGLFGQITSTYAVNPLRDETLNPSSKDVGPAPLGLQLNGYFTLGTTILDRGTLQLTLPLTLFQRHAPTGEWASLASTAPGDLRIDGRIMLAQSDSGAFRLAGRVAVYLPTGDEHAFGGDIAASGNVALAGEFDFGKLLVTLNAGAFIRPKTNIDQLTVGSELTYGLAVYVPLAQGRVRLGAEVFGSHGLLPETLGDFARAPMEADLIGRMDLNAKRTVWLGTTAGRRLTSGYAPDVRLGVWLGGFVDWNAQPAPKPTATIPVVVDSTPEQDSDGDGFADATDRCPNETEDGVHPGDGCPEPPDPDRDHIVGAADQCPDKPEDLDGVEDSDGCPDVELQKDSDGDGIADTLDKCLHEPGTHSEDPQRDGCPQLIQVKNDRVELKQEIEFEFGRAVIVAKSYPIIEEIAGVMRANPDIRLRIEGYTDNVGDAAHNERLSKARADAVREALVRRGRIAANRLTSRGFGAAKPIASNINEEGRAKNRRVEIHIDKPAPSRP